MRVVRSFMWNGEPTIEGAELTLPNAFAHEMRHSGKVEFIDANPKPVVTEQPRPNAIPPEKKPAKAKE